MHALGVCQVTRQAARADETGVETEKDTKSARKLSDVSFYGVGAMMRWVHCACHSALVQQARVSVLSQPNHLSC
jgi:hypothetical protein